MKKIGILGGTFDPIHYGHLILAEQARGEANLEQVIFMPAMVQPFKIHTKIADGSHRYAMLLEATNDNPNFSVSDIELNSPEISYTIKTLKYCKKNLGDDVELYFIIGTDAFLGLEKWYEAEELLRDFSFIIGSRPGYKEQELKLKAKYFEEKYMTKIIQINNSEVEISSSNIKERIQEGKSIKYLLPKSVEEYIFKNNLYK